VELPDGDVRRQHWWSSRITQAKAAALLEAVTGRDVSQLEAQRAGKADKAGKADFSCPRKFTKFLDFVGQGRYKMWDEGAG